MTDTPDSPDSPEKPAAADRIAKVMARAGIASRREAERMILEGRVAVNGQVIDSPALDVLPTDRVTVDGRKLDEKQETRLWLYYKPLGLITSESDEKGRQTVFDALPRDLPRVMTVGRLDLNSEGLLLLTNDGELKRRLELPSTGWLRRYRVRVNGTPNDLSFDPLRRGVTIDGEDFAPMEIKLDSQQGANAWLTVGIREGKNREIRRAMAHIGLQVNRLIRIGYGPFKLTGLEKNEVSEVKRRVLRDQLGGLLTGEEPERDRAKDRPMRPRGAEGRKPRDGEERGPRSGEPRAPRAREDRAPRDAAPRAPRSGETRGPRDAGDRKAAGQGRRAAPSGPRTPREGDGARGGEGKTGWQRRSGAGDEGASGEARKPRWGKPGAGSRDRSPDSATARPERAGARPEGKGFGKGYGKPDRDGAPQGRSRPDRVGEGKPAGQVGPRKPGATGARGAEGGKGFGGKAFGGKPGGKSFAGKPAGKPFVGGRPGPKGPGGGAGKPGGGGGRNSGRPGGKPRG